ncbi:phosphotransferase, partial [Clostridium perfringens]|nr:phosphotransferase [Clostridium perfringens]
MESVEEYVKHIAFLERDYHEFRKHQTYDLGEDQFSIYEESLVRLRENAQKHIDRISRYRNTTYIHGDLNVGNLLYPLFSNAKPYIIDLEAVKLGLCTEDLVMLFVHDLFHGSEETLRIFDLYY